jgi:hypothetical protein
LLRLPAPADNAAMETEPSKTVSAKRKCRWFQFSLRTLLIVVMLLAVPCAYVGWQVKFVRERKALLSAIRDRGGHVVEASTVPFLKPWARVSSLREWLGDSAIQGMQLPTDTEADEVDRIKIAFPESDITLRPTVQ